MLILALGFKGPCPESIFPIWAAHGPGGAKPLTL